MNRSAVGYWFVPGRRLINGEATSNAFSLINVSEREICTGIGDADLLGAFAHQNETNFAGAPDVATHYVVLACETPMTPSLSDLPRLQHGDYRWVRPG